MHSCPRKQRRRQKHNDKMSEPDSQPQEGMVEVNGRDVQKNRQKIAQDMAYVSQQNDSFQFTVYDAVLR